MEEKKHNSHIQLIHIRNNIYFDRALQSKYGYWFCNQCSQAFMAQKDSKNIHKIFCHSSSFIFVIGKDFIQNLQGEDPYNNLLKWQDKPWDLTDIKIGLSKYSNPIMQKILNAEHTTDQIQLEDVRNVIWACGEKYILCHALTQTKDKIIIDRPKLYNAYLNIEGTL